jgi:hypothetical protein
MPGTSIALTDTGVAILTNRITQNGTAPKYLGWGTGVNTTLIAAYTSGTNLAVASGNGFFNGHSISFQLTNGETFTTTINGNPSTNSIPLAEGASSGAAIGAPVWVSAMVTDTELLNEVIPTIGGGRTAATETVETTDVAHDTLQYQGTITSTSVPVLFIWEVGAFDAPTDGDLLLHVVELPTSVNQNDSIEFTLSIQFQAYVATE